MRWVPPVVVVGCPGRPPLTRGSNRLLGCGLGREALRIHTRRNTSGALAERGTSPEFSQNCRGNRYPTVTAIVSDKPKRIARGTEEYGSSDLQAGVHPRASRCPRLARL